MKSMSWTNEKLSLWLNGRHQFQFPASEFRVLLAIWCFSFDNVVSVIFWREPEVSLFVCQIRADPVRGGYVVASTAWSDRCPDDDQVLLKIRQDSVLHVQYIYIYSNYDDQNIRIVKLDSNLEVEWTEEFGECDGSDQLFDFVVDRLVPQKKSQKEEKYKKNSVTETL